MDPEEEQLPEESPIVYAIDSTILMHRDVHFGGSFGLMLDYYRKEGRGVHPEIELSRIEALQQIEQQTGKNLAPLMLSGVEAEQVGEALQAYRELRNLYESKKPNKLALLIADLILSEEEQEKAIEAVVAEKGAIVPLLIDLMRSDRFSDPLFPGYGEAPVLAAKCLARIGDKRAMIALFEMLGEGDFFNETTVLEAIRAIGEPAKQFLLKVLRGRPLNEDNERAALGLFCFKDDPQVALACFQLLKDIDLSKHPILAEYLVLNCETLPEPEKQALIALGKDFRTPKALQQEIITLFKVT